MKILVINPGSTSTKIGVFEDKSPIIEETIRHDKTELSKFNTVIEQLDYRKFAILDLLEQKGVSLNELDAVIGRGGIVKPIEAGTYIVNEALINDLKVYSKEQEHPSTLGGLIAYEIANAIGKPAFIADPVCVDEFEEIARISGLKEIRRKSLLHALNVRASMYKYAESEGKNVNDLNLIVAHLGGGITVAAIKKGRIVDVNNANEGGPFSPERTGSLPSIDVVNMSYSGKYTRSDLLRLFTKEGGVYSYLGTNNIKEVIERVKNGDKVAKEVFDAMCYQIAKEIGGMATVLKGDVEAIIITGGIAYNEEVIQEITKRVSFIAKVVSYPGEFEMEALAFAALRVLKREEDAKIYT
ncbi:butyrate kinase [Caldisericum exile]|uniref:Probable butyrate kinase n=1 Tax=Caldisericum exile (strain DSM 21853 / NBRC 104410 / AZM16c01) TaxID=511051 RepID=A0A7U6GEH8_CALEA|nr:butyrate kinase [Caldisericum exile]BAL80918.1 butyrate kinase [Caldisericum exile AZM16c01]